ncbi:hypothetical protein C815_00688 [Firmicutes bacterium M10-2]|nr:hypothetical protein C815_00688 [Firmicutes bacterium M10-2]
MICKHCSTENSDEAKFCSNCGASLNEEENIEEAEAKTADSNEAESENSNDAENETIEVVETVVEPVQEEAEWYYVANNASTGPFTEEQMKAYIEQGILKATTYVWKNGMEDWVILKKSELGKYLRHEEQVNAQTEQSRSVQDRPVNYSRPIVQERSIVLNVILSIVTCGIYQLIWLYLLAKDVNELSASQGKRQLADPIIVVLLTIVTCGLYGIYFFYQAGKAMAQLDSKVYIGDDSTLLAILCLFTEIVSMAILQNSINTFIRYGE